ncbi:MAG: hypothetical protein IPN81_06910 [Nitrosomonadales bacterium]|nr:hypothetical protein [Nitrosomonadales bacterium]
MTLAEHLPAEATQAFLLELANRGQTAVVLPVAAGTDPFAHPDAQRRFPWRNGMMLRNWSVRWSSLRGEIGRLFLHFRRKGSGRNGISPGPARVSGPAGKALSHFTVLCSLARQHPEPRAAAYFGHLGECDAPKLRRRISNEPRLAERLEVHSMNAIGERLYELHFGRPSIATPDKIRQLLIDAASKVDGQRFSTHFLKSEWDEIVDAWQLDSWEAYRNVKRLGRKTRLPEQ